jgi:cell wall-associated NlpC family hydrolase
VNVRDLPSETDGQIIGKLYNNSVGTFISEENGWYQISSGTVTGYVKGEYCVTGEEAVEIAKQVGTRIATVTTQTLYVRKEATTESSVISMVPEGEELLVLEEAEGWVKVDVEEGTGWISTDYVTLHSEFVQAESKEEEAARLAKEAEERKKARAAAAAKTSSSTSSKSQTTSYSVGEGSEMGVAVAQYALQFVGNPYVYGGTSLTNGADCSGFVMSVYANFGVSLPHSSASDRSQGYAVDSLDNAQPGDLICYSGHVALYIGNGQIVHASNKRTGIIVSNANYRTILAIRRIF